MCFLLLIPNIHYHLVWLLILVALAGDFFVAFSNLQIYKAVFDNATHAIIGGLSWFLFCILNKNKYPSQTILEIVVCAILASLIDVDHFLAAKSLRLKDAVNLNNRPILHCSTVPFLWTIVMLLSAYFVQSQWLKRAALLFATAFFSHHTRDATRRGFWFYPFGSTPPLPYVLYVAVTISIPYFMAYLMHLIETEKTIPHFRLVQVM